jgi:hypothetical protein
MGISSKPPAPSGLASAIEVLSFLLESARAISEDWAGKPGGKEQAAGGGWDNPGQQAHALHYRQPRTLTNGIMDETQIIIREFFSNPQALLIFAVIILVLFVGFLIFDPFASSKRRHHGPHSRTPRLTLRQRLGKPFVQMRAAWQAVHDHARRRARRRARAERLAEQMRRYSK